LLQSKNDKLQEELAEAEDAVRSASQHKNITAVIENENEEDDMKITPEVKEKVTILCTYTAEILTFQKELSTSTPQGQHKQIFRFCLGGVGCVC
jgi:hypothetical protein